MPTDARDYVPLTSFYRNGNPTALSIPSDPFTTNFIRATQLALSRTVSAKPSGLTDIKLFSPQKGVGIVKFYRDAYGKGITYTASVQVSYRYNLNCADVPLSATLKFNVSLVGEFCTTTGVITTQIINDSVSQTYPHGLRDGSLSYVNSYSQWLVSSETYIAAVSNSVRSTLNSLNLVYPNIPI